MDGRIRGERRGETRGDVRERVDVGQEAEAYRGENSGARNESSAVENPDRNQSDSICIMEKARDNVCTGLSARATFLSRSLFFFPPSVPVSLGPLNRIFLFSLPSPRPANSLRIGSGVRVEPKSLLMGSFGFDHRLTFPIHRWYVSLARPRFISSSLIYSFSYPPSRSNLYSIESLLSGLLIRHRLRGGEWNKERWNESPGKRRRKVRLVVKNVDWKINSTYLSRLHRSVR